MRFSDEAADASCPLNCECLKYYIRGRTVSTFSTISRKNSLPNHFGIRARDFLSGSPYETAFLSEFLSAWWSITSLRFRNSKPTVSWFMFSTKKTGKIKHRRWVLRMQHITNFSTTIHGPVLSFKKVEILGHGHFAFDISTIVSALNSGHILTPACHSVSCFRCVLLILWVSQNFCWLLQTYIFCYYISYSLNH